MGNDDLVLRVDGGLPLSAESVAAVGALCDRAEDRGDGARVIVHVSGVPQTAWTAGLTVALTSRWERSLRRLERLPVATVGVADGDCGGTALDALLATDYRIATGSARLVVADEDGAVWPGMSLYRLSRHGTSAVIRRAVLFGAAIDAPAALAARLIDVMTNDVAGALSAAAELTGTRAGTDLAVRRQLMFDASTAGFEESLGVHLAACDRALRRGATGVTP
ncbi:enoyl-CoA-hydratase DpgB [Streptomyces shenzhenensis]|uniref:enoyl-CoA-hydratase DpgB n=1 Tax=Streptomyces shenzhenensis TaxID=943815 RepID=UPI0015F0B736|nr:enoyl-CoA-hydratase DpgB [Streptomyces shenzhenensis]